MVIISPLFPKPVLKIECEEKNESFLVISDLHLGLLSKYNRSGVFIDHKKYTTEITNDIISLGKKNDCSNIIILGDLKDSIGIPTNEELSVIPEFFKDVLSNFDVYFIPGNHDGWISKIVPENVMTYTSNGMLLEDCLLLHGHSMPKKFPSSVRKLIMGHIHPIFNKSSSLIHGERVWIFMKVDNEKLFGYKNQILSIIIIPTFNKIYYPTTLNRKNKSISPILNKILKNMAIKQSFGFTLNGEIVGDLFDLNLQ